MSNFFNCIFCNDKNFHTLLSTENFNLSLDNFPIIPGHILLVSKFHFGCMRDLSNDLLHELTELKNKITSSFHLNNLQCIFYEHGRSGNCSFEKAKCEHFHLHCLPIDLDITDELKQFNKAIRISQTQTSLFDLKKHYMEYGNYLYFQNKEGYFYPENDKYDTPPHFLRTLICGKLGHFNRSNWKLYSKNSIFLESIEFFEKLNLNI